MLNLRFSFALLALACILTSCQKKEEARKPISQSKSVETKLSIDRNIEMRESEEDIFKKYREHDTANEYFHSNTGFWFAYQQRAVKDSIKPVKGDIVRYTYEVHHVNDSIIYPKTAIGSLTYKVDEEDILPVLRSSLKMLKAKEQIKVLTPSSLAYSYLGDQKAIAKNQPLILIVSLESITKSN
ncbi:gliding motility-associated peptidyl-prolyl isomerase GldI [Myroides sp. DF42-4-2]|uniref:gliding motility-associated peptidyl-prolyl isomerase GldI n=1 Tax=unclassified Myroides TaxID=2642485 RepID=UPI002578A69D|nr:gliding motility-associated peptidyl-prolyl isomerase GldI [Myroides sp. DF42-4-2]MDM1408121.1 gliding motility-associated peptidyl-prolyl isomerase GldI [Myroides sp. DF42-4-2]